MSVADTTRANISRIEMAEKESNSDAAVTMQCMEVWGGNQATDNGVIMPGLDAWVYSRPYRDESAGGDLHYVSSCATGQVTRLMVADVSGHGAAVARASTKLRDLMRRYVNYIDQTRFIGALNKEFSGLDESGGFATAVVATYWAPTDQLVLCNAGHPRPLWYRAKKKAWSLLEDTAEHREEGLANIPLGIAEPTRYDQLAVKLARGDLVVLYTDSLIEAQDASGRMLGQEGLLEIARGLDAANPTGLVRGLVDAVGAFSGGKTPADDITVLAIRPNDLRPRVGLLNGLKATGLIIWEFIRSLRPGGQRFPWPEMSADNILGAFRPAAKRRSGK